MSRIAVADSAPRLRRARAAVIASITAAALVLVPSVAAHAAESFDTVGVPRIVTELWEPLTSAPVVGETLVVDPMSDDWSPFASIETDWFVGGVKVADNASDYTPTLADYGKTIRVIATGSADGRVTTQSQSAPTLAVTAGQFVADTPRIMLDGEPVTGIPQLNDTLTVEVGEWMPFPDETTYQWLLDGQPIADATENAFTVSPSEMAGRLSVAVTGKAAGYLPKTVVSAQTEPVVQLEFTGGTVGFTGDPAVGKTLTAKTSGWPENTTFEFSWWNLNTSSVVGTGKTYVPKQADLGKTIAIRVLAHVGRYAPTSRSGSQAVISGLPTITGAMTIGTTVTASPGTWWENATFAYQWRRNGAKISGASKSTYKLTSSDLGKKLTVAITGTGLGHEATVRVSAARVGGAFGVAPVPTISGTVANGRVLTAKPGTWSPTATFKYQWQRDTKNISGATKSTYKLTSSDVGKKIRVVVTGSRKNNLTTKKTSASTASVLRTFTKAPTPTLSGTAAITSTLTAKPGTWSPTATLAYQWQRDGVDIAGATASSLILTGDDVGHKVRVRVTAKRTGHLTVTKYSASATVLARFTTIPTPTVSGTAALGTTLTAVPGTWSPSATLKYHWQRNGKNISGATKSTYKLTSSDIGKTVRVVVTGSRSGYLAVTKTSAATASVKRVFSKAPTPKVSGAAVFGSKLTAAAGTWSPTATLKYQWQSDGVDIAGATKSTYVLGAADVGKKVRVVVTASRSGYLTTAKPSAATATIAP